MAQRQQQQKHQQEKQNKVLRKLQNDDTPITYGVTVQSTFFFSERLQDPVSGGSGQLILNTKEFYLKHICHDIYPNSCEKITIDNSEFVEWNDSHEFIENFIKVEYEMNVDFIRREQPTDDEFLQTVLNFDKFFYLRNYVNTISTDMSLNFQ
jgi:hypothetical protein